ncbi:hypothetical protein [Gordonia sp. (in: high G+C Gram-positive bacteria)]|uniref:phage holin n=1 Tax=Gordonia sp. (in: high G+C Gram-positive bacteria) TaxID=84139 RepID=UPI0039E5D400
MNYTKISTALGVRTAADVRAVIYNCLPVLTTVLVGWGVATTDQAALIVGLVSAVAGPGLAWWMSRDLSKLRPALYAILTAAQAVLIGFGILDGADKWTVLLSALLAAIGGGVAVANTPVTSSWTRNVNGEPDPNAAVDE